MAKNLYAVIIGINAYPFNPLNGCIGDAMAVNKYFQDLCEAQAGSGLQWKPKYLLAPNSEDMRTVKGLSDTNFGQPNRNNIIAAFDHFKQAKDGDFCLLYYSGHGSTAPVPDVFMGYTPGNTLQTIVDNQIFWIRNWAILLPVFWTGRNLQKIKKGCIF